jgi:hypothetical protein
MLHNRNLVIHTLSEVYDILKPLATHEFWDISTQPVVPNSIYVIGRMQFFDNINFILTELVPRKDITIVFDNAAESASTLISQLLRLNIVELCKQKRILLLSGGEMPADYHWMTYPHFLVKILNYKENHQACSDLAQRPNDANKPWDFVFLNGRARPHRKYLLERLKQLGLLDRAIWTILDSTPTLNRDISLIVNGVDLMDTPSQRRCLPANYEYPAYARTDFDINGVDQPFAKYTMFNNEWGDIYLNADLYADTYFSLVTETLYNEPWGFCTEKIAKPIMIGHPWICASTPGYYRYIKSLGFQTFDHLIDESFDLIENHQDRLERIVDIVQNLCNNQTLQSFATAATDVCKYNQQRLAELAQEMSKQFPNRFSEFIAHNE